MSIYTEVLALGGYISNHESDLYIEVNPVNDEIIRRNSVVRGLVNTFRNEVTGNLCYEIPFAYDPFWESRARRVRSPLPYEPSIPADELRATVERVVDARKERER